MKARVLDRNWFVVGVIILSCVFVFPTFAYAGNIDPQKQINQFVDLVKSRISQLYQPIFSELEHEVSLPQISAQIAGFGGAGSLVRYFQEIDGTPTAPLANVSCPSGWVEALNGYGPHYVGIFAYNIMQDGITYGFNGFDDFFYPPGGPPTHEPADPPPPPEPGGPPIPAGDPPGGPSTPSGDPPVPPTEPGEPYYPPEGGPYEPPDFGPPEPGGVPSEGPPDQGNLPGPPPHGILLPRKTNKIVNKNFLFPTAHAQISTPGYTLSAVGLGSDSVCSQNWKSVVDVAGLYNNGLKPSNFRLYSDACYTSPTTGLTTCNRCRVCVK